VINEIARFVARAIPDCTAEEIADILWLATARNASPVSPNFAPQSALAVQQTDEGTPPLREETATPHRTDQRTTMLRHSGFPVSETRSIAATAVGLRAPKSMAGAITTGRMFSPFRRIHRPGPWEVDVDATVEATADAQRLTIVTRPARERGLDVALVADDSPVMMACGSAVAELEAILLRAGTFRSVSRWTLSPRAEEVLVRDRSGAEHIPGRLADPSGRRLVLLVTDATADHWYRPGVWQTMRDWAGLMPTAILHVLPQQYRISGPLGGSPITVRSTWPAAPNRAADVEVPWWDAASDGIRSDTIPIPVVELVPSELATWARAIAVGTGWVDAIWARQPSGHSAREANAELSTGDRVRAFQVRASRGAQALARILAAAPVLSLPLMSVLQSRLLPETGLSELAEVLVSGLLEQSTSPTLNTREVRFQFRTAVRDLLRRGTTAAQEWDTFRVISEYLEQNAGTGNSILALVADPYGLATVDAELEPFAAVGRSVAARLGIARTDPGLSRSSDVPVAASEYKSENVVHPVSSVHNVGYSPGVVVAVDGPPDAGRSSASRSVARALGFRYLDTGAMYRALTWWLLSRGIDVTDGDIVAAMAGTPDLAISTDPDDPWVRIENRDISQEIRADEISMLANAVAMVPQVRTLLLAQQQAIIAAAQLGIVVEGEDIGTAVAPEAHVKVYLTADSSAAQSAIARDVTLLNSADLTLDEVVAAIVNLARRIPGYHGGTFRSGTAKKSSPLSYRNDNEMHETSLENPVSEESLSAHNVPRVTEDAGAWRQLETIGKEIRLIRPYAVTGGRTQPRYKLAIEALVNSTVPNPRDLQGLTPECQAILEFCRDWRSVAEISAVLRLPLGVARVLVADMSADGLVRIHQRDDSEGRPDRDLLVRVLNGLRASNPSVPDKESDIISVKVVVAGGFGAGKTVFVGSVSEIAPLTSEAVMTVASQDVDDLSYVPDKSTMTAAMDFGRITLDKDLVLYIFGTPGVHRLWFMWDDMIQGAIGAVVLVDTRRLADSFPAIDYFEASGLPFVVGVNAFHGQVSHPLNDVREALAIPSIVPVIACDARNRESAKASLVTLVEHAMFIQTEYRTGPNEL
jgi:cytidylate kinase